MTEIVCENCTLIDSDCTISHHLWTSWSDWGSFWLFFFDSRPSRMEIWRRWRRRSGWKSANARDVRTRTRRAEMTGAPRPRRGVDAHQLRNSPLTPPNWPSKWTPSSIQSSTTEMGKEIFFSLFHCIFQSDSSTQRSSLLFILTELWFAQLFFNLKMTC